MSEITTVGLDVAKNVFQVDGADALGRGELRKKLRRDQVLAVFRAPRFFAFPGRTKRVRRLEAGMMPPVGVVACYGALLGLSRAAFLASRPDFRALVSGRARVQVAKLAGRVLPWGARIRG